MMLIVVWQAMSTPKIFWNILAYELAFSIWLGRLILYDTVQYIPVRLLSDTFFSHRGNHIQPSRVTQTHLRLIFHPISLYLSLTAPCCFLLNQVRRNGVIIAARHRRHGQLKECTESSHTPDIELFIQPAVPHGCVIPSNGFFMDAPSFLEYITHKNNQ